MPSSPRLLLIVLLAVLVPIIPFVLFGDAIEAWVRSWLEPPPSPTTMVSLVIGVLATDIFLPIPSSFVSTVAGVELGIAAATLATWVGMTIGAIVGFALARWCGRPLAERFSSRKDLEQMDDASGTYGPIALIALRAVPVLAEASVLIVGVNRLAWPRFLWPVMLSNLVIAAVYSTLGHMASDQEWLGPALVVSITVPAVLTLLARRWLKNVAKTNGETDGRSD